MRYRASEGIGESGRRLTDEEGVADAREVLGKRGNSAFFGQPSSDPVDSFIAGQRFGGRVGVGCFGIIDVSHSLDRRDELLAMGQSRK